MIFCGQQISSGNAVSEGPHPQQQEAGPKEDVQASSLYYNRKVESGSITFNFNSLAPVVGGATNGRTENVNAQSVDSRDVLDHKNADSENLSDARQVHCNSSEDTSTGKILNDFSASSEAQCVGSKDMSNENAHDQSLDDKNENSVDFSSNGQLQFASSKSVNSLNSDGQTVDSHVLEHRDPGNDSVVSLGKYDEGESSFSVAGCVTYSGPVAYSGSLSLRSDGSATSGRSFAFPMYVYIASLLLLFRGEHFWWFDF